MSGLFLSHTHSSLYFGTIYGYVQNINSAVSLYIYTRNIGFTIDVNWPPQFTKFLYYLSYFISFQICPCHYGYIGCINAQFLRLF